MKITLLHMAACRDFYNKFRTQNTFTLKYSRDFGTFYIYFDNFMYNFVVKLKKL